MNSTVIHEPATEDGERVHERPDSTLHGIFDGFEAYQTLDSAASQAAIGDGLVVVDTNVLLNLYRYDDTAREDLFKVLEALGDRLFVPHQVVVEFWRNRENVLRDRLNTARSSVARLDEIGEDARNVVREWANRLAISDEVRDGVLGKLSTTFNDAAGTVSASAGSAGEADARDTSQDPVLLRLEAVLSGKVGQALTDDERKEAVSEGHRRLEMKIPPGFKDNDKRDDEGVGDYLVWHQTLREAARRPLESLMFVTGDTAGDDWWRRERGELRGPRIELHAEARLVAHSKLLLLRPQSLVLHAQEALDLEIGPDTVTRIGRADETSSAREGEGWSKTSVDRLLARLQQEGPVQYEAMMAAIGNGGFIGRDPVYAIGGFDSSRTLRGFTRPARRIMQDMQDAGLLADEVPEPLETVYDAEFSTVQAYGFRVPAELVAIVSAEPPKAIKARL